VLSPPLRESRPPPAVRLVPAIDDARCEGVIIERAVSWSVETVGAIERPPTVGGGKPSVDNLTDSVGARDVRLEDLPVRPVIIEGWLCCAGGAFRPDWRYGLFCMFFAAFRFAACRPPSEEAALRLASFFIKAEKGRRRPVRAERSAMVSAASNGLSGGAELRLLRWNGVGKCGMSSTAERQTAG
jgi:hypothetical protein